MDLTFEEGTVVALGNFDGLHIGHMTVIRAAENMAAKHSVKPYALIFDEHPVYVLTGKKPPSLFSDIIKDNAFKNAGIHVFKLDFRDVCQMSPETFFEKVIIGKMHAVGVCCGFNYTFGKGGSGNAKLLENLCRKKGIEFSMSPEKDFEGEPVSSTRIRLALEAGHTELANSMLGRPFTYGGIVIDGDKRGRALGIPTINQSLSSELIVPKYGVYMSKCNLQGKTYYSVTNLGVRPTIGGNQASSETHILDFKGDLYGTYVEVSLLKYLRSEKKFQSIDELKSQMEEDIQTVRGFITK